MKHWLSVLFIFFFSCMAAQKDSVATGKASYYAKKFEGRKTASGQIFHHSHLTAAHKTLPFGTKVRVFNIKNEKSIIVTINDRLPASSKRSIDLSHAAAKELDFIKAGLANVRIEILSESL